MKRIKGGTFCASTTRSGKKTLSINFILKCNDNCKDRNQCRVLFFLPLLLTLPFDDAPQPANATTKTAVDKKQLI
jgi:hypothetical protein